jgi:predicted nucleic acid-binding protein
VEPAFWDSSALVPLCVQKQASPMVRRLLRKHEIVVWWTTPVEMRSAFARLLRTGHLMPSEHTSAGQGLEQLRRGWRELQPTDQLRAEAEMLLDRFPLKAADTLQLAAALTWASGKPRTHVFISGDAQLLQAARQLGFQAVQI